MTDARDNQRPKPRGRVVTLGRYTHAAMPPPVLGRRAAPLEVAALDVTTVAELARVLEDRLAAVAAFGGCGTCHNAEARAFLAQLRQIVARDVGV